MVPRRHQPTRLGVHEWAAQPVVDERQWVSSARPYQKVRRFDVSVKETVRVERFDRAQHFDAGAQNGR
jgi:hypothetical protein